MCLVSYGLALYAQDRVPPQVADRLLWVMVGAWVWTCAQALPLPRWFAEALHLQSVQNAARLEHLVDFAVPLTVSVDPGETQAQVVVGIAILSAFLSGRLLELRRPGSVARAAALAAALVGLSGVAHELLGATAVFGIHEPRFTNSRLLSPIMNNNHIGGFLAMGALVGIGLAADGRDKRARAFWVAVAALCGSLVPWILSRGAIGVLVLGTGFLLFALKRRQVDERRRASGLALAVASAIGVAIFFALEPILRRFEQQDVSKLEMAFSGFRLFDGSTWWLGVGRGAFSPAFAAMEGARLRITHPENLLVQWTTEWGLPIAMLLVAALATALLRRFRSIETATGLGLFVGLFALALQNMVDFSLEMPAVAVVAAASLGALLARNEDDSADFDARRTKARLVALGSALAAACVLLAPRVTGGDTQSQADRLTRAMQAGDDADFQRTLDEALKQHPTEPVFPLLAGAHALRRNDPKAPQWLSISMIEAPGWGSPHVLAAEWLNRSGRLDQALLEVREAESRTPGAARNLICEIVRTHRDVAHLERAAPTNGQVRFYDRAASCVGLEEELREAIDARILSIELTHVSAVTRQAKRLNVRGNSDQASALLDAALSAHPESGRLWAMLAATHILDRALEQGIEGNELLVTRARAFAALNDRESMIATLTRLRGLAKGNARKLAAARMLEGDLEASVGNVEGALEAYREADRADPSSSALHRAAVFAARMGRRRQAYKAYRELCRRDSSSAACKRRDEIGRELGAPTGGD